MVAQLKGSVPAVYKDLVRQLFVIPRNAEREDIDCFQGDWRETSREGHFSGWSQELIRRQDTPTHQINFGKLRSCESDGQERKTTTQ